jgi:polysaccharide biosynthesis protein PslH
MNILFLSTEIPFPADHGHHIRTSNVLKYMAKNYNVHFVGFYQNEKEKYYLSMVENMCETATVFLPRYYRNIFYRVFEIFKSVITLKPIIAERYNSKRAHQHIAKLCKDHKIDLVHVDMLHLMIYKKSFGNKISILTEHNVEYVRLFRRAKIEKNPGIKLLVFFQACLVKLFEKKSLKGVNGCIAVSEHDQQELGKLKTETSIITIANGVDTDCFQPVKGESGTYLLWTGNMAGSYNRDAILYFMKKIWPKAVREIGDIRIKIVGDNVPTKIVKMAKLNSAIKIEGYVDDVRPFMTTNAIFVAPIRAGGGTKIKILNAMAMSLAVITTSTGIEGIKANPGEHVFIANNSESFINFIKLLWGNSAEKEKVGMAARNLILQKYSWDHLLKNQDIYMRQFFE